LTNDFGHVTNKVVMRMVRQMGKTNKNHGAVAACASPRYTPFCAQPSPAPAPADGVGVAIYTTLPNGIVVPAEFAVAPEPDKGEWQRGRLVPVKEFYETLQRKRRFLRRMLQRLRITYLRNFIGFSYFLTMALQLVAQAMRPSLPRPNRLETLLDALLEQLLRLSQKANRSPPEKPADIAHKPSPSWLSPTIPAFCRAPDAAARLAWRVAG
jgi:hypothetical protein